MEKEYLKKIKIANVKKGDTIVILLKPFYQKRT